MPPSEILPSGFPRDDLVRLLTQCIHSLGYESAAQALEKESGIPLLAESVAQFRTGILEGRWDDAERLIEHIELRNEDSHLEVRFLVLRQKFLELVEVQRTNEALRCLRQQLAPLETSRPAANGRDGRATSQAALLQAHGQTLRAAAAAAPPPKQLLLPPEAKAPGSETLSVSEAIARSLPPPPSQPPQPSLPVASAEGSMPQLASNVAELSSYLMCKSAEELRDRSGWDGAAGLSRRLLLQELQQHIPPSHLLPENRLQTLLQQAISWQVNQCLWRDEPGAVYTRRSLLENVSASRDRIPRDCLQTLEKHSDEVWFVKFSHDGKLLASASKDNMVVLWDVSDPLAMGHTATLQGHTDSLSFVAWSPDDSHILTCGNDRLIKLWEVGSGACLHTFAKHSDAVTACAWMPDGRHFVSAGVDKNLHLWARSGEVLQTWHGPRVNDLAVSHNGERLVAVCSERKILLCAISKDAGGVPALNTAEENFISEEDSITSLALSADSRHVLVNVASEEIHAWDLQAKALVHRYRGQKQGRFVIRSAFGGHDEAFVVSGSEDSQVYIWNRHSGALLEVLPGHSGTVNAIAWNPTDPHMFASASDDHTVRVWGVTTSQR